MKKSTFILMALIALTIKTSAQWSQVGTGLSYVYSIVTIDTCILASNGNDNKVYRLFTHSSDWVQTDANGISSLSGMCINDTNAFVAGCSSVYRTSNYGNSWNIADNGLPTIPNTCILSLCSNSNSVFAGTYHGIYKTDNNGSNWTAVNAGIPSNPSGVYSLYANNQNIYAGTWSDGVYLSTNDGNSWVNMNLVSNITNICSITSDNINVYIASYYGVFQYNGTNWSTYNPDTTWVVYSYNGNVFSGTNHGVKNSTNNGLTWNDISIGLPTNTKVYSMTIKDSFLFIGTKTGVFKRALSEITNNSDIIYLKPNSYFFLFPNPASTIVNFNINNTNNSELTVNIFTVMGVLIRTERLIQNQRQINITDLNNGVYLVKIKSKGLTENQSLIIQR